MASLLSAGAHPFENSRTRKRDGGTIVDLTLTSGITSARMPNKMVSSRVRQREPTPPSLYRIRVLERVFRLLDILSKDNHELGLVEITKELRLHKSSTHRLLMALEHFQYVSKNPVTGKYSLGGKLIELGMKAVSRLDLYQIARPYLERLVAETGETAHVGVLQEGEIISIVNVQSSQTLRLPSTVGRRAPVHCSSLGKAITAFLSGQEAEEITRDRELKAYTRRTITKLSSFRKELKKVRDRGYAVDDEEFEEGLRCVGAPIQDHTGKVIAAISIAGPAFRLKDDRLPALAQAVKKAAAELSGRLGYRNSDAVASSSTPRARG